MNPRTRTTALIACVIVLAVVAGACRSVRRLEGGGGGALTTSTSPSPSPSIYVPTSPIPGQHRSPSPVIAAAPIAPTSPLPTSPLPSASPSGVVKEGINYLVPCGRKTIETTGGVEVTTTWTCYEISAGTYNGLLAQARRKGPEVEGSNAIAATRWKLTSQFSTAETPDGCDLTAPNVTTTITYIYPRVTNDEPTKTIDKWESFMSADVIPHEETHRSIAVDGAEKIVSVLDKQKAASSCGKLEKQAKARTQDVIDQVTARQQAFDDREAHE